MNLVVKLLDRSGTPLPSSLIASILQDGNVIARQVVVDAGVVEVDVPAESEDQLWL
jgi:hypothetical protein